MENSIDTLIVDHKAYKEPFENHKYKDSENCYSCIKSDERLWKKMHERFIKK